MLFSELISAFHTRSFVAYELALCQIDLRKFIHLKRDGYMAVRKVDPIMNMKFRKGTNEPICTNKEIKCITTNLMAGLSYIHTKLSIIHRDLRPENIFIKQYMVMHALWTLGSLFQKMC